MKSAGLICATAAAVLAAISVGCGGGGGISSPPPPADFAISTSGPVSIAQGGTSTPITVSINAINGFTGSVSIVISGLPADTTTTPSFPLTVSAGSNAQFTITLPASTPPGTSSIVLTGSSGSLSHSASAITLTTTYKSSSGFQFNGIHMQVGYFRTAYDGLEYQILLNNAVDMNANYVGIGGVAAVDLNTGQISDVILQGGYDESVPMSSITTAIVSAESKGLNVVLKPIVGAINSSTGQFANLGPTNLAPGQTLANPAAFFANYKAYLLQWAQIAQQYHVPLLVLGTEMQLATEPQFTSYWTDIIASVRQAYSGKLTYAAVSFIYGSTYNEVGNIQFWNNLDYVGVDAYPQVITGLTTPTAAQIDAAWSSEQWKQTLASIAANTGKPIIFTECGVASYLGSLDPNYSGGSPSQDFATQTNWYQSFVDTWTGVNQPNWFQGAFFWDNDPAEVGMMLQGGQIRFDIAGKPANTVVASMFGGVDYLAPLNNVFAGSTANDQIALYGDMASSGGAGVTSRQQTYQTTISLYVSGSIMNGATPTMHVYINGTDYGTRTLDINPSGYVDGNGVSFTGIQRFDFAVNGLVPITQLQVTFASAVNVGGPENSLLSFSQINIDGVPITQATYYPQSGAPQQQIISPNFGGTDTGAQYDGGYTLFDATPYNQQVANLPGSAANPITVNGGGGTDAVHVLGTANQYTVSGIG